MLRVAYLWVEEVDKGSHDEDHASDCSTIGILDTKALLTFE